ncbi:MAG: InlB B-repeat-containing protein [Bacilli bacterium]|nr:InlB B-repeat-containing protein [Bacilli bacterium]
MRKKLLIVILAFVMLFMSGCDLLGKKDNNNEQTADGLYEVYKLAAANGYEGSYDDWIESIRGKDGKTIELVVDGNYLCYRYTGETILVPIYDLGNLKGEKGDKGDKGDPGDAGAKGDTGATGNGISKMEKVGSTDTADKYRITFTDGTFYEFEVAKGTSSSASQKFNVSFKDGENTYRIEQVEKYSKATKPEDPTKEGYKFVGWYDEYDEKWVFGGYIITEDMDLFAKWEVDPNYTTFDNTTDVDLGGYEITIMNAQAALTDIDPFLDGYTQYDKAEKQRAWREIETKYNCRIKVVSYPDEAPWGQVRVNWLNQMAHDYISQCDLAVVSSNWIPNFVKGGAALDVTTYYEQYGNNIMDAVTKEMGTINNQLFVAPNFDAYVSDDGRIGLFYNYGLIKSLNVDDPATLFNQGKWNYTGFTNWVYQVQTLLTNESKVLGGQPYYFYYGMTNAGGVKILDPVTGEVNITSNVSKNAMNLMHELTYNGCVSTVNTWSESPTGSQDFFNGGVVMTPGYLWFVKSSNRWDTSNGLNWGSNPEFGYVPFPYPDNVNKEDTRVGTSGSSILMFTTGHLYPEGVSAEGIYRAYAELVERTNYYVRQNQETNPTQQLLNAKLDNLASVEAYQYYDRSRTIFDPAHAIYSSTSSTPLRQASYNVMFGNNDFNEQFGAVYDQYYADFASVYGTQENPIIYNPPVYHDEPTCSINGVEYNSLQLAIAAANEGDTIVLKPGSYYSTYVIDKNNITIEGPNKGKNPINGNRSAEAVIAGKLSASAVSNLTIDGIAITGSGCLNISTNGENITLKNIYVHDTDDFNWSESRNNSTEASILFNHLNNQPTLKNIVVSNCYFENINRAGLYLARLCDVKVERCEFHNFTNDAIRGDGGYNYGKWEFLNNKFYNDAQQGTNGIYLQSVSGSEVLQEIYVLNNEFINIGDVSKNTYFSGAFSVRTYQEQGLKAYFKYNKVENCLNGVTLRNNGARSDTYIEEVNYNIFKNITNNIHKSLARETDTETTNPILANFDYNLFLDASDNVLTYDQVSNHVLEVISCQNTFASYEEYLLSLRSDIDVVYTKYVIPTLGERTQGEVISIGSLQLTFGSTVFTNIHDALQNSIDNDVIFVAAGTYDGNLEINNSIRLYGPNAGIPGYDTRFDEAIINGKIVVNANNVVIDGFTCHDQTTFTPGGEIVGFNYLNNVFAIKLNSNTNEIIDAYTANTSIKDIVISGNYGTGLKIYRGFSFGVLNGIKYNNNKIDSYTSSGYSIYDIFFVGTCLYGNCEFIGNTFAGANQAGIRVLGVGEMTLTIKDNLFKDLSSTAIDTRDMKDINPGNVQINIVHNTFDNAGSDWRCIRPRTANYGDYTLDVQVHYNSFINGSCTVEDGVISYANNPIGDDVIYNMDNNYFQEVKAADLNSSHFANSAYSWANCYDSIEALEADYIATLSN